MRSNGLSSKSVASLAAGEKAPPPEEEDTFEEEEVEEEEEEPKKRGDIHLSWCHWAIVGAVDVLGPFASDAYTPNTIQMRDDLGTTNVLTGLTLQLNWLSKGLATLWIGALSDMPTIGRLGAFRRTFVMFTIGAVGAYLTPNASYGIFLLLGFRVIEGFGESATTICSAIARDAIEAPEERIKVLTVISSLRLFAIAVAPTLGGIIGDAFGWRILFLYLAIIAVLLCISTFGFLPETLHTRRDLLKAKRQKKENEVPLLREENEKEDEVIVDVEEKKQQKKKKEPPQKNTGFGPVIYKLWSVKSPEMGRARAAIIDVVFSLAALLCFLSDITLILQDEFGVSVVNTALLMGSDCMIYVFVNVAMAYCFSRFKGAKWLEPMSLFKFSLRVRALSSITSLICAFGPAFLREHWIYVLLNSYLFGFGLSFGFGATNTLFIQPFPEAAGKAAALLLISRTMSSSSLSQVSIDIVDAFGLKGYYACFAVVSACSQLAWLCFPAAEKIKEANIRDTDSQTAGESLREHLLRNNDEENNSTVASSTTLGSEIGDSNSTVDNT